MRYIIPSLLIVAGLVIACIGLKRVHYANQSSNWPKAEGVVLESELKKTTSTSRSQNHRPKTSYHAVINYEFEVSGIQYTGNRVSYGDQGYKDPGDVASIVKRYPKGRKIQVSYRSEDPNECLLETGLQKQAWYMPLFGLGLLTIGAVNLIRKPAH